MAHQIQESTQTAQAAEEFHPEDTTSADIAKAPTLPSQSEAPPAREIPGEGVGLSIVKRFCELLDAGLELEKSPGKGSIFQVILPGYYAAGGKQ
jgi:signal transduction histidine kinase